MSANNQTLIKQYEGKYLVFDNVNAEAWVELDEVTDEPKEDQTNVLYANTATGCFEKLEDAVKCAMILEADDPSEYGIQFEKLIKDESEVTIK